MSVSGKVYSHKSAIPWIIHVLENKRNLERIVFVDDAVEVKSARFLCW